MANSSNWRCLPCTGCAGSPQSADKGLAQVMHADGLQSLRALMTIATAQMQVQPESGCLEALCIKPREGCTPARLAVAVVAYEHKAFAPVN